LVFERPGALLLRLAYRNLERVDAALDLVAGVGDAGSTVLAMTGAASLGNAVLRAGGCY
jgi:hypothetical protein